MRTPQTVKELAVDEIRERILSGKLRQKQKINQDELAAELQVSKLPIREALIVLGNEGLVQNVPRRGAYVAPLSREDVRNHYMIFGFVSGLAAERAASLLGDDEISRLQTLVECMDKEEDEEKLGVLNEDFHTIINKASGSVKLRSMIRTLEKTLPTRSFEPLHDWARQANVDHRLIVQKLAARDVSAVRQITEQHFNSVADLSIAYLEQSGFWEEEE